MSPRRLDLAVGDNVLMGAPKYGDTHWTFQIVAKLDRFGDKFLIAVKLGIDICPYQIVLLDADLREVPYEGLDSIGFYVIGRSRDSRTLLRPMSTHGDLTHRATYNEHEPHLGPLDECQTCAGRGLMLPKPPKRIKDRELLARFREVRPRCQVCETQAEPLETHHMTDLQNTHRRSDVFPNLMRLCRKCHHDLFHDGARWTKPELRWLKNHDEQFHGEEYAELELLYDGTVLWAYTEPTS